MRVDPKAIRAAGVDPKAWARYNRHPYGTRDGASPAKPQWARLEGGPFDGYELQLRDQYSGTLEFRYRGEVGRYVWHESGYRYGEAYGYLEWKAAKPKGVSHARSGQVAR